MVDHCVSQEFLAAARTDSRAVLPPLQFKWLRQCLECDPPVPGVGLRSIPTQGQFPRVQLWRRIIFRLMEQLVRSAGSWFIYSRPSGAGCRFDTSGFNLFGQRRSSGQRLQTRGRINSFLEPRPAGPATKLHINNNNPHNWRSPHNESNGDRKLREFHTFHISPVQNSHRGLRLRGHTENTTGRSPPQHCTAED